MQKISLTLLLIITIGTVMALQLEVGNYSVNITGDLSLNKISIRNTPAQDFQVIEMAECSFSGETGYPVTSVWSQTMVLPETGNYVIRQQKYDHEYIQLEYPIMPFDWEETGVINDEIYGSDEWYPEIPITISDPVIMRDIRFSQVSVYPYQYNPAQNRIRLLTNLEIELQIDETISLNAKTRSGRAASNAFNSIYSTIAGYTPQRNDAPGVYLIIAPEECLATLQPLKQWKERSGFQTHLVATDETGDSELEIKNYLQNAYDTWEDPPEYVILAGDVNGNFTVPAFYIEGYYSAYDVTDHSYALLEGDDYFPDIMVGRLSYQSLNELQTIVNKIIFYESAPYQGSDWFERAIMTTYIDQDWMNFYSAWETKKVIREKLLDFTYTEVDTFYVPFQNGTSQFINLINDGCTFLNYRGAGAPSYWWAGYGPLFSIENIDQLSNGYMLPLVTSITCGGGNFADEWYDTSFGEAWLAAGTPSNPKGAIGFIGPSELDTKTPFNNANDMGIYNGITQEGIIRCGEMLLRGKMELYNNYPNGHDMDGWNDALDSDQFYFYVYNLLGDPGLAVWTETPAEIVIDYNELIPAGSNFLEVAVTAETDELAGFMVSLTNESGLLATAKTNSAGIAYLNNEFTTGSYSVTATKYGFIPETGNVDVEEQSIIGLSNYSFSSQPVCGTQLELMLQIQNLADIEATGINVELSSADPYVNVISSGFSVPFLEAQNSYSGSLQLEFEPVWMEGHEVDLFLDITSSLSDLTYLIPVILQSPELVSVGYTINSSTGNLEAGETCDITFDLYNSGSTGSNETEITLISESGLIQIEQNYSILENIEPGEMNSNLTAFTVSVSDETITGESVPFLLYIGQAEELLQSVLLELTIGTVDQTSPTFSSYGYKAFESNDSGNFSPPEYDWIEISVNNGGPGTQIYGGNIQPDGFTDIVELPFTFSYYGINYDQVAICSNGYLALGDFNGMFFRNRVIPSGVGSPAMIAPFWDNLKWGDIFGYYNEEEHYFVIQWEDWQNAYNPYSHETFQVILYDPEYYSTPTGDGPILFQYKEVNNVDQDGNFATVGIEDHTQTEGLLITYANLYPETVHPIQDETAILITTGEELFTGSQEDVIPGSAIELLQNYPNPFNPETTISFYLSNELNEQNELPELFIFNIKGQKIKTFAADRIFCYRTNNVFYSITWDGTDQNNQPVPSGIYFYQLTAGNQQQTRKMILLK